MATNQNSNTTNLQTLMWHFQELDADGESVAHNVVFDEVESPIQTEGTFNHTFEEPGTYQYICTLHPFMEGAVLVIDAPQ